MVDLSSDRVAESYAQTLAWTMTECREDGSCGDSFHGYNWLGLSDLPNDIADEIRSDVAGFLAMVEEAFDVFPLADAEQTGHDLYLTCAHHGAGFWDGDYPQRYVRHVDTGQESGYGQWHSLSECIFTAEPLYGQETRTLGDILTDMAHTFTPPFVQIEIDGKWWTA